MVIKKQLSSLNLLEPLVKQREQRQIKKGTYCKEVERKMMTARRSRLVLADYRQE